MYIKRVGVNENPNNGENYIQHNCTIEGYCCIGDTSATEARRRRILLLLLQLLSATLVYNNIEFNSRLSRPITIHAPYRDYNPDE